MKFQMSRSPQQASLGFNLLRRLQDILLCSFVRSIVDNLNEKELQNLLNLLNVDDENLYKFKKGIKINTNIENNKITKLFKNYVYTK